MFDRNRLQRDRDRRTVAATQAERMRSARAGERCPDCGETDAIEDNGAEGPELTWRCQTCACQWDATVGADA